MQIFKTIIATGAAVACLGVGAAIAQDYKDEYRVSTVVPAPFPWGGIAAEKWAELTAERTDGRIKLKVYPVCSLCRAIRPANLPRCVRA